MTSAFLLLTLACPVGVNPAPVTALTTPLICSAWGDKVGKPGDPTPFRRFLGLFHRQQSSAFPTPIADTRPVAAAPVSNATVAPAPVSNGFFNPAPTNNATFQQGEAAPIAYPNYAPQPASAAAPQYQVPSGTGY